MDLCAVYDLRRLVEMQRRTTQHRTRCSTEGLYTASVYITGSLPPASIGLGFGDGSAANTAASQYKIDEDTAPCEDANGWMARHPNLALVMVSLVESTVKAKAKKLKERR